MLSRSASIVLYRMTRRQHRWILAAQSCRRSRRMRRLCCVRTSVAFFGCSACVSLFCSKEAAAPSSSVGTLFRFLLMESIFFPQVGAFGAYIAFLFFYYFIFKINKYFNQYHRNCMQTSSKTLQKNHQQFWFVFCMGLEYFRSKLQNFHFLCY